ncbi:MAG TPA: Smr/MutS family protein, partial [bacterium]|nr:Smr/MutS family protein [bacterium]
VLLDELGAGTDPIEGGALGIAILDELRVRKATTLVTTHLDDLKVYAHLTEGVINAAMQFDLETLQPTYRLTLGIAGESNALRIASRLGMPAALTDRAEAELAGRETEEAGALYRRLVSEVQSAHQDRQKASQERNQVTRLAEEHRKMVQKLEKERHDILHRARIQAQRMVEDARRKVKDAEREFEIQRQLLVQQQEKNLTLEPVRQALDQTEAELGLEQEEPLLQEPEPVPIDLEALRAGDMVQVAGFMKPGKVLKIDRERGEVLLTLSSWEMTLPLARLAKMVRALSPSEKEQVERQQKKTPQTSWAYEVKESPGMEIHLRQMRVHEGLRLLDRYLEDAFMAGLDEVRVIHGIGTGAMLRAVHEALRDNHLVKKFRLGEPSEGGGGATIVTFRER